jgi:hypothetical protein
MLILLLVPSAVGSEGPVVPAEAVYLRPKVVLEEQVERAVQILPAA